MYNMVQNINLTSKYTYRYKFLAQNLLLEFSIGDVPIQGSSPNFVCIRILPDYTAKLSMLPDKQFGKSSVQQHFPSSYITSSYLLHIRVHFLVFVIAISLRQQPIVDVC